MEKNVKKYREPLCFYGSRLLRTALFYASYAACAFLGTKYVPFGDPEDARYDLLTHHMMATPAVLISFLLLTWIFSYYDPSARDRFIKAPPEQKHFFSEWFGVLRSCEFLCDVGGMLLLPLVVDCHFFNHLLWFFFRQDDFTAGEQYVRCLVTVFPLLLLLNSLLRTRVRSYFRVMRAKKAAALRFAWLKIAFFTALLLAFFLYPQSSGIAFLIVPITLIAVLTVLTWCFLLVWNSIRAILERCFFLHSLKGICRKNGYTLTKCRHPLRSVFYQKEHRASFTVEIDGKRYACKLLANIYRRTQMIFLDETLGYFHAGQYFRTRSLSVDRPISSFHGFMKLRFYHDFDAGEDTRVLIVSPKPLYMATATYEVAYQTESATHLREISHNRMLDNADVVHGALLFDDRAFLNAISRGALLPQDR